MEHQTGLLVQALQLVGWMLTLVGQVQIGNRVRGGFATWVLANLVMTVVAVHTGLYWSIGMYVTNIASCCWSYWRWREMPAAATRKLNQHTGEESACN